MDDKKTSVGMVQNPLFLGNITDHQRARQ